MELISGNIFDKIIVKPEFDNYIPENKTETKATKEQRNNHSQSTITSSEFINDEDVEKAINKLTIIGLNYSRAEKIN